MGKRWLQQPVFSERVKDFCRRKGLLTPRGAVKMEEVADLFDLHPDTLRQFMYDSSRPRPHLDTLACMAGVMGLSVAEFLDDPGGAIPPGIGISPERWASLSDRERALASGLVCAIAKDDLGVAEKEELCKLFQATKKMLLRLRKIGTRD